MEDFGAQFYFSIAATSFLQFYFSIATTSSWADFLEYYLSIATTSSCAYFLEYYFSIAVTSRSVLSVAIQRVRLSAREGLSLSQGGLGMVFKFQRFRLALGFVLDQPLQWGMLLSKWVTS